MLPEYASAIAACKAASVSGKAKPLEFRRQQLESLRRCVIDNEKEICEALKQDLRRNIHDSFLAEIVTVNNEIVDALDHLEEWSKDEYPSKGLLEMMSTLKIRKEPFGMCLVMSSWNYPFALLINPLVAAIAAGNCVVIKPSEGSAHTAKLLQDLLPRYIDPVCYPVLVMDVAGSTELLRDYRFDMIFFTGGTSIGRLIMKSAAEYLTPVVLELGGKNPCYIDDTCDIKMAAKRVCYGRFTNAGQICLAPDYVVCDKKVKAEFIKHFKFWIKEFYGENPQKSDSYARLINGRQLSRLKALIENNKKSVVIGGEVDEKDLYIAPTLVEVDANSPFMKEEMFGPILMVVEVASMDDAIKLIQSHEKPLALYMFSSKSHKVDKMLSSCQSGGVCVNDVIMHYIPSVLPFGGVGNSGIGHYHGKYGFDAFTHKRSVWVDGTPEALLAQRYPPFTRSKINFLKRVLWKNPKGLLSNLKTLFFLGLLGVTIAYAVAHCQ